MTNLEQWASTFDNKTQHLYQLEKHNKTTGIYMTKDRYGNGVPCYYWTTPLYHVWINDKWELTTQNIHDAYACYERRTNDTRTDM